MFRAPFIENFVVNSGQLNLVGLSSQNHSVIFYCTGLIQKDRANTTIKYFWWANDPFCWRNSSRHMFFLRTLILGALPSDEFWCLAIEVLVVSNIFPESWTKRTSGRKISSIVRFLTKCFAGVLVLATDSQETRSNRSKTSMRRIKPRAVIDNDKHNWSCRLEMKQLEGCLALLFSIRILVMNGWTRTAGGLSLSR